jgi:taurine dioxygenase
MPDGNASAEVRIVPLAAPFGARIEGVDRTASCDDATRARLNQAFLDHHLLVLPGPPMTPQQMAEVARLFGTPRPQLLRYKHHGGMPEVSIMISTIAPDGSADKTAIRSEDWHSDDSYFATPAKATLLHAIELPSRGGATWFCDMEAAYAALPDSMKARIDGRRAAHAYDTVRARHRPSARTALEVTETPDVVHPLVRTHPETGRKALYLNSNRLDHILGLERAESDAILDELGTFVDQPRFHHGHVWALGDLVIWDNRSLMHKVVIDYPIGEARVMQRVLLEGDVPF